MEMKMENDFKAVDFMRQVRDEMSALYYRDKKQYHDELKKAMADFLGERERNRVPTNQLVWVDLR